MLRALARHLPPASASAVLWRGGLQTGLLQQSYSSQASRLHFCIVGSGPAGFYTADKLLKKYGEHVRVDILDQLATPFGLVRSGVAPDHPETKNVEHHFTRIAEDERCTFVGNVRVGTDIQLPQLRSLYSGVVLASGSESDRKLGIPGEDAPGVLPARRFVWWYNGHPVGADESVDLSRVKDVAVLGLGNVALDCARLLLSPVERLSPTDIADRALQQLRANPVHNVHIIARRGWAEAACTPKELRELLGIVGSNVSFNTANMPAPQPVAPGAAIDRIRKRLFEIFSKAAAKSQPSPEARQLHFHFLRQPKAILTDGEGCARGLEMEATALQPAANGRLVAAGTGELESIPAQLVLVSIGYTAVAIQGVGFDSQRGIVLNRAGRVLHEDGTVAEGVYACGWLMRGPSGIIGTNLANAEFVADVIGEDTQMLRLISDDTGGTQKLLEALRNRGVQPTSLADWQRIDSFELREGQRRCKAREKLADTESLLRVATGYV